MRFFSRAARFLLVPMALLMLLTGISPITKTKQEKLEAELSAAVAQEFVPVFRFAIASDVHIKTDDPVNAERFAKLFETAYRYSDAHPTYKALDAVLLAGDNCNNGSDEEYAILNRVVAENLREETAFVPIMGNHEFRDGGHEGYERNMPTPLDLHVVVKGFHIIGLSPSSGKGGAPQSVKQANWLYKELKKAEADDPEKPIFTMQHGHIWHTVYVSRSWFTHGSVQLHTVYSQFPQVINFSGHSHGPINNPITVWQNSYTQVGTGTMNYFEMEDDIGASDTVPPRAEQAAQYTIVEVDAQNRVRMLPFDIVAGDFMKTPSTTDDLAKQLIRQIDKPSDPSAFVYTSARRKTASKPWFDKDAAVTVDASADKATVTFDSAEDNECVYAYAIKVAEAAKPKKAVAETGVYAEYYFELAPETQSCTLEGLEAGKSYVVTVTPMNVWLQKGDAISAAFTTPKEAAAQ